MAAADNSGEQECSALATADFSSVQDAPTQITAAVTVNDTASFPRYCRVEGYISPQIGIELRLPSNTWNGKFVEVGCGGGCGVIDIDACEAAVRKGYACIASDMGHKSVGDGRLWAYNNLQAKVDFAYRSTHVAAVAGKAIAQRYYNHSPAKSYFIGCSNGGRQGLIEAERFPWDFDGIVAGAPPLKLAAMNQLWFARAALGKDGRSVLTIKDTALLHQAALEQCDLDDGLKDGIIGNPRACHFDPVKLACRADRESDCLTAEKLVALKKIYAGPVSARHSGVYSGGEMPGSELGWVGPYFAKDGSPGSLYQFSAEKFRYTGFMPDLGPSWVPEQMDFDSDYTRAGLIQSLDSAANPDLRQFMHAGGKLIMYQGWNDAVEVPLAATDFYETAERIVGDRHKTQDFFRLFMIPGMGHCGGGEGVDGFDYLSYLEDWVEHHHAPDSLVGHHVDLARFLQSHADADHNSEMEWNEFNSDPRNAEFYRPIYPYPLRAQYRGSGNPKNASSFKPVSDHE